MDRNQADKAVVEANSTITYTYSYISTFGIYYLGAAKFSIVAFSSNTYATDERAFLARPFGGTTPM